MHEAIGGTPPRDEQRCQGDGKSPSRRKVHEIDRTHQEGHRFRGQSLSLRYQDAFYKLFYFSLDGVLRQ